MCANAISQLNLKHVYFGCKNERFGGCGSVDNTIFDVPFTENFENSSDRAVYLLKAFYCNENPNAPEEKRKASRRLRAHINGGKHSHQKKNLKPPGV